MKVFCFFTARSRVVGFISDIEIWDYQDLDDMLTAELSEMQYCWGAWADGNWACTSSCQPDPRTWTRWKKKPFLKNELVPNRKPLVLTSEKMTWQVLDNNKIKAWSCFDFRANHQTDQRGASCCGCWNVFPPPWTILRERFMNDSFAHASSNHPGQHFSENTEMQCFLNIELQNPRCSRKLCWTAILDRICTTWPFQGWFWWH